MRGLVDEALAEDDIEKKLSKVEELIRLSRKEEPNETEQIELEDRHRLGIATVGALKQHPRISAFATLSKDGTSVTSPRPRLGACRWPVLRDI